MKKLSVRTQQMIVIAATIVLGTITVLVTNDRPQAAPQVTPVKAQAQVYKPIPAPTVDELLAETNKARTDNGLQPLVIDERLNVTAQAKCQDMLERNYWQHDTPDGVKPWQALKDHGILYQTAGENLGYGFDKAKAQVDGWMKSPGHKANLLHATFTNVGFGICKIDRQYQEVTVFGSEYIIVQHFILPQ